MISQHIRFVILLTKFSILFLLFNFFLIDVIAGPSPGYPLTGSQKCKEIDVDYKVVKETNGGSTHTLVIDLKQMEKASLMISLVGPNRLFLNDVNENEIKNLNKGTYSLVIVGRSESSGYCPKHFQVIVK